LVSGHHIGTHCRSDAFCAGTLKVEYEKLHKTVLTIVREDAVCRRLMTVPRAANRQWKSQSHREVKGGRSPVRAHAEKYQSGEKDATSGITRAGDEMVRTAPAEHWRLRKAPNSTRRRPAAMRSIGSFLVSAGVKHRGY
jgi:transposase